MMSISRSIPSALLALALAAASPAGAADTGPATGPGKNELTVFGGISILDVERSAEGRFDLPQFPGFPGFPGRPGMSWPALEVRGETSLGESVLFGARYSRYLKDRLAVEVDFAVAPTHEVDGKIEVCAEGVGCFGGGDYDAAGLSQRWDSSVAGFLGGAMGQRFRDAGGFSRPGGGRFDGRGFSGGRDVTAWHYGAGATYDVLGGDVRPFLLLGAGGVSYTGAIDGGTDFVLRFGGGLKAWFGRVGLRLDVTDHLVVDHELSGDTEHDVHATAGVAVRF